MSFYRRVLKDAAYRQTLGSAAIKKTNRGKYQDLHAGANCNPRELTKHLECNQVICTEVVFLFFYYISMRKTIPRSTSTLSHSERFISLKSRPDGWFQNCRIYMLSFNFNPKWITVDPSFPLSLRLSIQSGLWFCPGQNSHFPTILIFLWCLKNRKSLSVIRYCTAKKILIQVKSSRLMSNVSVFIMAKSLFIMSYN